MVIIRYSILLFILPLRILKPKKAISYRIMNRIETYKKLFGVVGKIDLAELKLKYRSLIKEWHPDKIVDDEERKAEAEIKSEKIIKAYHFLVGIAPETHAANAEEYKRITTTMHVEDFEYKGTTLKITFAEGIVYEYYGVPKSIYTKMVNSPTIARFGRRHVYDSYTFRNVSKSVNA
jgi:KTSC domain/DnaJ domain